MIAIPLKVIISVCRFPVTVSDRVLSASGFTMVSRNVIAPSY